MKNILHGLLLQEDCISMSSSENVRKTLSNKTTVIREVYDGINSQERFEYELECALEANVDYIVIEPTKLGKVLHILFLNFCLVILCYRFFIRRRDQ